MAGEWKTVQEMSMEQCCDAVEWCPHPDWRHLLACGMYQLVEGPPQRREGGVAMLAATADSLATVHRLDMPAVLDMKWCLTGGECLLAVADAKGCVSLFRLMEDECGKASLKLEARSMVGQAEASGQETLALSLDWRPDRGALVATDSSGVVSLHHLADNSLALADQWRAHSLEAWVAAYCVADPNIVYSGGDDCELHVWDARDHGRPSATCRSHEAGVTALHSQDQWRLVSGSYDERIRLWDGRHWKRPLAEAAASGGVWRLKRGPSPPWHRYYLAACVYGGFQVVDGLTDRLEPRDVEAVGHYSQHSSICYGADWQTRSPGPDTHSPPLIATCSFYDNKLCLSTWTPPS